MKTLFEICTPREDVLRGAVRESEFAADLAQVLDGGAPEEYLKPDLFFANTHPTEGLKALLENVCSRLSGRGGEAASLFRLDTQYGGGKTHALIALSHAAGGMAGVANPEEFLPRDLIPTEQVNVAAFDGENADPVSGRPLGHGLRAYTPWGELAYRLAGVEGYELVRRSDLERVPPGADTFRELFAGKPTLILLDELSIYLRKVRNRPEAEQLTPFLTGLFKAVESSPRAALVFTLAIGKGGEASDAYTEENEFIHRQLEEAERVAARMATLIDPTAEHETPQVLRRRLFRSVDTVAAAEVVEAYRTLWGQYASQLPEQRVNENRAAEFLAGYPFHPALMSAMTDKLATLSNFQRVRGMLRLLTQTVANLWQQQPTHTYAIHLNHLDPGYGPTHNEVVTRLEQRAFDPAIRNDVSSGGAGTALAEQLDIANYTGMPPYTSFVARTALWHTFAFNEQLKGVNTEDLGYSILAPDLDPAFITAAAKRFQQEAGYLDDRPTAPMRFHTEANLEQLIRGQMRQVDAEEVRQQLQGRIRDVFEGRDLSLLPFVSGPHDVDDSVGDGRPLLVLLGYEAEAVGRDDSAIPPLVASTFKFKGSQNDFRVHRNNLVFIVASERQREEMRQKMTRRLALDALRQTDRLGQLAEHQQEKVKELYQRSSQEVAVAIQQCYRHLFYPSVNDRVEEGVDLAHATIEPGSAAERPGNGQQQVLRALADGQKLLRPEDRPLAPAYVRDQTPLKRGQITTAALRNEFRQNPRLPIMLGDDNLVEMVRKGVEEDRFVYKSGELLLGPGDPWAQVKIDGQSFVYTMDYAKEHGIWPRPAVEPPPPPGGSSSGTGGPSGGSGGGARGSGGQPPVVPPARAWKAEAPLREALTRVWEQARRDQATRITSLSLRVFDATEAFRLFVGVNGVAPDAEKTVAIEANYETTAGSMVAVTFEGGTADLLPVREFLEPQFRAAADHSLDTATCRLTFASGLDLAGDEPEKLTDRLARFASGSALVEAGAEAEA